MNREKSIALYMKCEEARQTALDAGESEEKAHEAAKKEWNAWANECLKEKKALKSSGEWKAIPDAYDQNKRIGENEKTRNWLEKTELDFSNLRFIIRREEEIYEPDAPDIVICNSSTINFEGYIFPGYINFSETKFTVQAEFTSALFYAAADLGKSRFLADVNMDHIEFGKITDFSEVQINGTAAFFGARFKDEAAFRSVSFIGPLYLGAAQFDGEADFREALLNGGANFDLALFKGPARFQDSHMGDKSSFRNASFKEECNFSNAGFSQEVTFEKAIFSGSADFSSTQFKNNAGFIQVRFLDNVSFSSAVFRAEATFTGLQCHRSGDFSDCLMLCTPPDFNQASFSEATRFDNIQVPVTGLLTSIFLAADQKDIAKFHVLRRLSQNTGNMELTQKFFKGEMRVRRGTLEKAYHPQWWISLLYDLFADYGRAVMRPFLLWLVLIPVYAQAYLFMANRTFPCSSATLKAHYLSAHNALLNLVAGRTKELEDAHNCLYTNGHVPDWLSALTLSHTFLSAIFLLLILLGLRSRFRF